MLDKDLLESRREFLETIKGVRALSSSFSFKDIECVYKMDEQALVQLTNKVKERVGQTISSILANEDFKSDLVTKPAKTIKDVKSNASPVLEAARFDQLKSASLKYLGAFELSKHASHHVLSTCFINGAFMATGHVDSTFKIWLLNPQFFDTCFTSLVQKKITSEEIMVSGTGSGAAANFKRKEITELKPDSQVLPVELVLYFHQVYTSTTDFHKHFVTAINFLYRKKNNQMLIMSGDASGDFVISELSYSNSTFKVDEVNLLFRRKAHKNQITCIVNCSHEDAVLTGSHDKTIA